MRIAVVKQPPGGPADKPLIVNPVRVFLRCPVYYDTGAHGLLPSTQGIFCARLFAETVLRALEEKAVKYHWGIVHVGVYNPRKARHEDGSPILPVRWSNHAWARAIDWKGLVETASERYLSVPILRREAPVRFAEIVDYCAHKMRAASLLPEIVQESTWVHIGYFP